MNQKKGKILGIGGVSRAGKSTLANVIKNSAPDKYQSIKIIEQDAYTLPEKDLPQINDRIDWEHPSSINWEKLVQDVETSRNQYDLIIIEGILAYANSELNKLYDFAVFLTITKDTFMQRRIADGRWGEEPEWYITHVWHSYLQYGLPNIKVLELEGTHLWIGDKVIDQIGL